jgi:acetyl-CoA synthetase
MIKKDNLYFPSEEFKKSAWLNDKSVYEIAGKDPVKFWEDFALKEISWNKKWEKGYEYVQNRIKWFLGGKLNITESIFSEERKNRTALIWEPEPTNEPQRRMTFGELEREVNKFAGGLLKLGVKKGDRVAIYMPMVPETVVVMLSCAKIGAVHAVIFSAFSSDALRYRLQSLEPKILITADGYYRRGQIINLKLNADEGAKETSIKKVVVVKRAKNEINWNDSIDVSYEDLIKDGENVLEPEFMDSEDLLFVLPESGTSGQFLPVMHVQGGYTVYAKWSGKAVLDFKENDILWCGSDAGWITGHTYTIYSPLLNGTTTLIYEGAPDWPSVDRWAQIIEKNKVTIFYTAPTALRMFAGQDKSIAEKYKFESLRLLGSVGEAIDETTWLWYFENIGKGRCPLVDTWWQTETGGIMITSLPGMGPFRPAFTGLALPGINIDILNEEGKSCKVNEEGSLVILPPFPPAMLRGIYNNQKDYVESYWSQFGENVYFTSDGAFWDENGLVRITGRTDDTLKVAGHRIATGELENAILKHPRVRESGVTGVPDKIKGEVPVAFVVLKQGGSDENLKKEIIEKIKNEVGPIALPKEIYFVEELPKTRSGKIMRGLLKNILTGKEFGNISALSNPESLNKIKNKII